MNIRGKIHEIFETAKVTDSFKKREFVIEYKENPQYPEFLKFEFIQDKCSLLDNFKTGNEIEVYFNLKGREWTNPQGEKKYFNTLQAWKLEAVEGVGNDAPQYNAPENPDLTSFTEDDVLPF